MSKKHLLLILLAASLVLIAACNDDDDCTNCPGTGTPYPSMANIWPHSDGNAWTFGLEYREFEPVSSAVAEGFEIPSMEELHALLQAPMEGAVTDSGEGLYRMALDGNVTTQSGVVAQQVVETFYVEVPDGAVGSHQARPVRADRTLAMIAQARPDLRAALASQFGLETKSFETIRPPYFLGGYAFACEDSGYFGYGDLLQNHSWVYLEGDLRHGSEFSLQLATFQEEEIWLYGRIWSVGTRIIGGQTYRNALECMYVVDFGEMYFRTAYDPEEVGPVYPCYYGSTLFVPGVGPVAGIERHVFYADETVAELSFPDIEYVLNPVGATTTD